MLGNLTLFITSNASDALFFGHNGEIEGREGERERERENESVCNSN